MQKDYKIEELSFQSSDTVTYRARKHNGRPHTLTRLNLPDKILTPLQEGQFRLAYARLIDLKHGCLRAVADGGLDPIDQIPWVATRWWEGKLLADQIKKQTLKGADIARIRFHGEALIHDLGDIAGALSFDPRTIVTTRSLEGEKVTTFEINYARWFTDWARGIAPGAGDSPYDNLNNLISKLEDEIEDFENKTAPVQKVATTPSESVPVLQTVAARPTLLTTTEVAKITQPAAQTVSAPAPVAPVATTPPVAAPPVAAPTSANLLPSAAAGNPTTPKKLAFIGSALAAIILSAIMLGNQDAKASSNKTTEPENKSPFKAKPDPSPNKPVAQNDSGPKESSPSPKSSKKTNGLAKRPKFSGEMLDIDADDKEGLADNIGDWVVIRGRISKIGQKGSIQFEDSPLQGFLLSGSVEGTIGSEVHVTGILTSAKTLRIEKAGDISGLESKETIYTLKDESLLRTMEDEQITLKARVKDYTESESGNTLYLIFHENGAGFRAGISPEKTGSSTNEEYLRQFIGKEILITGKVSTFEKAKGKTGKRLVIRFRHRADIKMAK